MSEIAGHTFRLGTNKTGSVRERQTSRKHARHKGYHLQVYVHVIVSLPLRLKGIRPDPLEAEGLSTRSAAADQEIPDRHACGGGSAAMGGQPRQRARGNWRPGPGARQPRTIAVTPPVGSPRSVAPCNNHGGTQQSKTKCFLQ